MPPSARLAGHVRAGVSPFLPPPRGRHICRRQWADRARPESSWCSGDAGLLLRALPGAPALTVASAAELIDRTFPAVSDAIARLINAGVLNQITIGKRNRAFEANAVIDVFTSLERQLCLLCGGHPQLAAVEYRAVRWPT